MTHGVSNPGLDGTVKNITVSGGTVSDSLAFTYDAANRITQLASTGTTTSYGHDAADRLTSVYRGSATQQAFSYYVNGVRSGLTTPSGTATYSISSTSNRVNSVSGLFTQTDSWDANGSLTKLVLNSATTITFTYDARNRMRTSANSGTGITNTYSVNGLGQRVVKKPSSGSETVSLYDDAGKLLGLYDGSASRIQEYGWLGDANDAPGQAIPVAVLQPGLLQFVNSDHLNGPRSLTYASGSQRWLRERSFPFGDEAPNQNPAGSGTYIFDWRDLWQVSDSENTLFNNMLRDDNPANGSLVESDAAWLGAIRPGTFSSYAYASNSPTLNVDPFGLSTNGVSISWGYAGGSVFFPSKSFGKSWSIGLAFSYNGFYLGFLPKLNDFGLFLSSGSVDKYFGAAFGSGAGIGAAVSFLHAPQAKTLADIESKSCEPPSASIDFDFGELLGYVGGYHLGDDGSESLDIGVGGKSITGIGTSHSRTRVFSVKRFLTE